MKKINVLFALVIAMILLFSLCSCTDGQDVEESSEIELLALEGLEEYKIVRGESSTDAEKEALVALGNAIHSKTGILLKVATDYSAGTKEILVGNTKRKQSTDAAKGLKFSDYVIKQDGNKIVILGGSDEATAEAVKYFIENYIDEENKAVLVPSGKGFVHKQQYKLKTFTIGDVSIDEFKIKANEQYTDMIEKLRDDMLNVYMGCELEIDDNVMVKNQHYIVFESNQLSYADFAITAREGNLYITGSESSIKAAVDQFYKLMDNASGGVLKLSSEGAVVGKIKVPEIPYKNKEELLKVLEFLHEDDRLLFGQHLAGSMNLNSSIKQYADAVGEGPAIMDIDLLSLRTNTKDKWGILICKAVEYAAQGGIITTMHHWENPCGAPEGQDAYRGRLDSIDQWKEVLTHGTELNKKWHEELDRGAEFLKALDDAGVSVIYRPMHEANGYWFWFCAGYGEEGNISGEDMVAMWKYVYEYYTEEWELDNLLWSYSPNLTETDSSALPITYYYPGDEYCDIVGLDWYTGGNYEIEGDDKNWDNLLEFNKPAGLAEWGLGSTLIRSDPREQNEIWNCNNYVEILEQMRSEGKSIAFAEVYRDQFGAPSHVGNGEALANYKYIVSLEEMPAFIAEVLGK